MFLSINKNSGFALIYDIGNASVGGALVMFSEENNPKIIYATRSDISNQTEPTSGKLIYSIAKSLEIVSRDIEKNGLSHLKFTSFGNATPKKAFCVLSSPWHISQTRTILMKKDKSFAITKKLIDELVAEEINNFKKSPLVKERASSDKNVLIESKVTQIKLNGYETNRPEGKTAETLQISAFFSLSPEDVMNTFAERIKKVFNIEKIYFNSFPLASFAAVKKALERQDFIFVDISGETTDVLLVKDGTLAEIITFPLGKKSAVRELVKKLKTTNEEALSLFYLYQEKKLSDETENKINGILSGPAENWLQSFRSAMISIGDGFSLPSTVFFTSDKDAEVWFYSLIKKEDYSQFTLTESPFLIKPIDVSSLGGRCQYEGTAKRDPFLAIGAIFASGE